jgi:hypothetical protein
LCKLGIHKWKNYGKHVLITWKEPGFVPGIKREVWKYVFSERECLRCGIKEKRRFSENLDGTLAAAGWKRIEKNKG